MYERLNYLPMLLTVDTRLFFFCVQQTNSTCWPKTQQQNMQILILHRALRILMYIVCLGNIKTCLDGLELKPYWNFKKILIVEDEQYYCS